MLRQRLRRWRDIEPASAERAMGSGQKYYAALCVIIEGLQRCGHGSQGIEIGGSSGRLGSASRRAPPRRPGRRGLLVLVIAQPKSRHTIIYRLVPCQKPLIFSPRRHNCVAVNLMISQSEGEIGETKVCFID